MNDLLEAATTLARTMPLDSGDSPRQVARRVQEAVLDSADPAVVDSVRGVDRAFDARVAPLERALLGGSTKPARTVTPGPDLIAVFAAAWAMGAAAGAGRLTGGTELDQIHVVAPTVVFSVGVALVLLGVGVAFARRERGELRAQRANSAAVMRAGFVWTAAVMGVAAVIGMTFRVLGEAEAAGMVALVAAVVLCAVAVPLAIAAQKEASRGVSGGRLHPPSGARAGAGERMELLSASEDAQDRVNEQLSRLTSASFDGLDAAFAAAVAEIARRGILPASSVKRLRATGWVAARYLV